MGEPTTGEPMRGGAQASAGELSTDGRGMPRRAELLTDLSLRTRIRRPDRRRFPFPVPNGWFIVATSESLPQGAVVPLHYFGRDLVLFRTSSGAARVTDAYCAHLGAHLGVGGRVEGERLVCPFHGWCYDGATGVCTDIPYSSSGRIPTQARVRSFPVLERNRMLWTWFHLEGKPPFYDVPEVPEFDDPAFGEPFLADFVIDTICQEMAENNHDPVHFRFVHGTDEVPEDEVLIDGTYKRVVSMGGSFVRETFGLGLGVLRVRDYVTFLTSTTPIDDEGVHVRWIFLAPATNGPDAAREAADAFMGGLSQDVPIWENKRYVDRPVLVKEERGILDHRQWCRQFYSDPALAVD